MKALVLALVILFAAIGALWLTGSNGPHDSDKRAEDKPAPSKFAKGSLGSDAVLAIAPGRAANSNASSSVRPMPATLQEFYKARSYAPLYARLKDSKTRTPEESWMLSEILTRCARVTEPDGSPRRKRQSQTGSRERFAAALAPNDPDRDRRIAAYDAVNFDVCSGIGDIAVNQADIRALIEAGAAGGDPKARAALVQEQLEDALRGPDGKQRPGSPPITDAQVETLRQVIASGDALALRSAVSLLMGQYANMSLRDADDRAIDPFAFYRAGVLLACDYGLSCGPDAEWVATACANWGQCGANSLRDHMMYYNSSPASSQVIASYEAALRNAAQSGNWSFFHFYPGPSPVVAARQNPGGGP